MKKLAELNRENLILWKEAMQLYVLGFPPAERDSVANMRLRFENAHFKLYFAQNGADKMTVMGIVYELKKSQSILLEYFSVEESERGKGLARYFLNALYTDVYNSAKNLILEVVNPEFSATPAKELRKICLFESLGARLHPTIYFELPFGNESGRTKMRLLYKKGSFQGEFDAESALAEIFEEIYNKI